MCVCVCVCVCVLLVGSHMVVSDLSTGQLTVHSFKSVLSIFSVPRSIFTPSERYLLFDCVQPQPVCQDYSALIVCLFPIQVIIFAQWNAPANGRSSKSSFLPSCVIREMCVLFLNCKGNSCKPACKQLCVFLAQWRDRMQSLSLKRKWKWNNELCNLCS